MVSKGRFPGPSTVYINSKTVKATELSLGPVKSESQCFPSKVCRLLASVRFHMKPLHPHHNLHGAHAAIILHSIASGGKAENSILLNSSLYKSFNDTINGNLGLCEKVPDSTKLRLIKGP